MSSWTCFRIPTAFSILPGTWGSTVFLYRPDGNIPSNQFSQLGREYFSPYTTSNMKMKNVLKVFLWLAVCQLPMLASVPFVDPNMGWYHTLTKPPFVPPDMIFGMVWTVLYLLIGLAAVLVFYRGMTEKHHFAAWLLGVQLMLNACWTPVFFGMHNFSLALAVVVLMLAEGFFMHRAFAKHSQLAALMLWPYWLWLMFATYLTAGFMMLN